jgi:HK97 family phage prohead protease
MKTNNFTFIINTETLNRYGYRILTGGIDLKAFKKNPVALLNHDLYKGVENIVGKWVNLRVEKDGDIQVLKADLVLDEKDERYEALSHKINEGFISACSVGVNVLELNEISMLPNQTRPTISKCELVEISLVVVPANKEALVQLQFNDAPFSQYVLQKLTDNKITTKKMDTTTELQAKIDALQAENATIKAQLLANAAKDIVAEALSLGKITKAQVPVFTTLALGDLEGVKAALAAIPATTVANPVATPAVQTHTLTAAIAQANAQNAMGVTTTAGAELKYDVLAKQKDAQYGSKLAKLKAEDNAAFEILEAEKRVSLQK